MNKLYIMRHAESEANRDRIMASRLPFPLTKAGKTDSELIAKQLSELTLIDKIISSPLLRATQTADSFCKQFDLTLNLEDRIQEHDLGIYSGMSYDQVKIEDEYEQDSLKRWSWTPKNGESYSDIAERVRAFFIDLESSSGNTLIVTHAVVFRMIRALLENKLPKYPKAFPNNGEIWEVDFTKVGEFHNIKSIFLGNSKTFIHNP